MRKILLTCASLSIAAAVHAAKPMPPEPPVHPDWRPVNDTAITMLKESLIDPSSAQVIWTSGFQWGYVKNVMVPKQYGWIACGRYNAKNRLGGYVGFVGFLVLVDAIGSVHFQIDAGDSSDVFNAISYHSTCLEGHVVPVNPELKNVDPGAPAPPAASGPKPDPADELAKLAALRDKGIITAAEFEAEKEKLLAQ